MRTHLHAEQRLALLSLVLLDEVLDSLGDDGEALGSRADVEQGQDGILQELGIERGAPMLIEGGVDRQGDGIPIRRVSRHRCVVLRRAIRQHLFSLAEVACRSNLNGDLFHVLFPCYASFARRSSYRFPPLGDGSFCSSGH